MKSSRFVFALVCSLLIAMAMATTAQAGSILVTTSYDVVDQCLFAPDTERFALAFSAKVRRHGIPKPNNVEVKYKVADSVTGTVFKENVTLKKARGYKKVGSALQYVANHTYNFNFVSVYHVPGSGKKVSAKTTDSVTIGSAEFLAGLGLPACV